MRLLRSMTDGVIAAGHADPAQSGESTRSQRTKAPACLSCGFAASSIVTESTLRARHGSQRVARGCFHPLASLIRLGVHRVRENAASFSCGCVRFRAPSFRIPLVVLSEASFPVWVLALPDPKVGPARPVQGFLPPQSA
jgi:hypothetical protein